MKEKPQTWRVSLQTSLPTYSRTIAIRISCLETISINNLHCFSSKTNISTEGEVRINLLRKKYNVSDST